MEKLLTLKNNIPILIIKLTKKNSLLKKKQNLQPKNFYFKKLTSFNHITFIRYFLIFIQRIFFFNRNKFIIRFIHFNYSIY